MRCPVSGAEAATSSLPKSLATASPNSLIYSSQVDESVNSSTDLPFDGDALEELRLVGDLEAAQVGQIKRFSIDAPSRRRKTECNVLITG